MIASLQVYLIATFLNVNIKFFCATLNVVLFPSTFYSISILIRGSCFPTYLECGDIGFSNLLSVYRKHGSNNSRNTSNRIFQICHVK